MPRHREMGDNGYAFCDFLASSHCTSGLLSR